MINEIFYTMRTGAAVVGLTGVCGPLAMAVATRRGAEKTDPIIWTWAKGLVRAADTRIEIRGLEKLPSTPCVLVSNHEGHFDVPVILASVPRHLRFVAKKQLADIPVFGPAIRAVGMLIVDRTGGEKDRETMARAVQAVRERVSILFFAEGKRVDDGTLAPFKKGAFILALQAGVPVVPMAISGTRHIHRKGTSYVKGRRKVGLVFGDPIPTEGLQISARDELMAKTRAAVERLLQEAKDLSGDRD